MCKVKNFKTHAFITKNCYDLLSETDDEDYRISVSTLVKLVRKRRNEDLIRAKKKKKATTTVISRSKLSRDIEKKRRIGVKVAFPGAATNYLKHHIQPNVPNSLTDL